MATLASLTTQAASVGLAVVPATGPTSGPYASYVLVPGNLVSATNPTGNIHAGNGHLVDELAASITAGAPIVLRPSTQQDLGPTDQVWG